MTKPPDKNEIIWGLLSILCVRFWAPEWVAKSLSGVFAKSANHPYNFVHRRDVMAGCHTGLPKQPVNTFQLFKQFHQQVVFLVCHSLGGKKRATAKFLISTVSYDTILFFPRTNGTFASFFSLFYSFWHRSHVLVVGTTYRHLHI